MRSFVAKPHVQAALPGSLVCLLLAASAFPAHAAWSFGMEGNTPKMGYSIEEDFGFDTWFTCSPSRRRIDVMAATDTTHGHRGTVTLRSGTGSIKIKGKVDSEMFDLITNTVSYSQAAGFLRAKGGGVTKRTDKSTTTLPSKGLTAAFSAFRKACRL